MQPIHEVKQRFDGAPVAAHVVDLELVGPVALARDEVVVAALHRQDDVVEALAPAGALGVGGAHGLAEQVDAQARAQLARPRDLRLDVLVAEGGQERRVDRVRQIARGAKARRFRGRRRRCAPGDDGNDDDERDGKANHGGTPCAECSCSVFAEVFAEAFTEARL